MLSPSPSISSATEASQNGSRFGPANPSVSRVVTVLPTYLASAVRRYLQSNGHGWVAAITMSFLDTLSFGNKLGSMMSLEIMSNKVERVASVLFDVSVELAGEHRYLILPTGLRILPSPDLVLRGCKRDVILEVFGRDITTAIMASPAYKEEAEQGNPLTECVTMTISNKAKDGAVINLSLDEKEGFRVKAKLYD